MIGEGVAPSGCNLPEELRASIEGGLMSEARLGLLTLERGEDEEEVGEVGEAGEAGEDGEPGAATADGTRDGGVRFGSS